jgi:multiple sugar transport system permease protein
MRYLDFGYGAALVTVTFLVLVAIVGLTWLYLSRLRAKTE